MPARILLTIALASVISCGGSGEQSTPEQRPPVILISVDTLRADHLSSYGYRGVQTPALDKLRADSILFENAYAPCPLTLPSHVSMLSGLLPPAHGVRNNAGYRFDPARHTSLPAALKTHGYRSAAAVSSYVLRKETGLGSIFDHYDDAIPLQTDALSFVRQQRQGMAAAAEADRWITANATSPFFYFLHLYEPHTPYEPPEPFRSRYANPYDGEIAQADAIVGQFLERLRTLDLYDRALIIFTSDHGEGLNDHGEAQHGILIYRETVRVPLFVKLPRGERKGTTIDGPVSLVDIFPTVTQVLGLPTPQSLSGRSLLASVQPQRSIYSESYFSLINLGWSPLRSLRTSDYTFIESPKPELYNLRVDPGERRDIAAEERRQVAALREALAQYPAELQAVEAVDPDTAAKLAALGYIGSTRNRSTTGPLPNPREAVKDLSLIADAFKLADDGKYEAAIAAMRTLLAANPRLLDVQERLAATLALAGRDAEAIASYQETIRQAPETAPAMSLRIADLHLRNGRLAEAEAHAQVAVGTHPLEAHTVLARIASEKRDFQSADAHLRSALESGGQQPATYVAMSETLVRRGALNEALAAIDAASARAATVGLTKVPRLQFMRGDVLARLDRHDQAVAAYEKAIIEYPHDMQAYANLAALHAVRRDGAAFDRTLEQLIRSNPGKAARELAAATAEAVGDRAGANRWRRR